MNKILFTIIACILVVSAMAQTKGTLEYLDKNCGIYPIMLNDSITKHLKVLTPIGKMACGLLIACTKL